MPQHAAACRSMLQHAAAQEIFPRDRTSLLSTVLWPSNIMRWFRQFLVIYHCLDKDTTVQSIGNSQTCHMTPLGIHLPYKS